MVSIPLVVLLNLNSYILTHLQEGKYIYIYSDKRFLQFTFYTNKKNILNIISDLDSWESVDAKNATSK